MNIKIVSFYPNYYSLEKFICRHVHRISSSDENLNPIPIHDGIGNGNGNGNGNGTGMGLGLKIFRILITNIVSSREIRRGFFKSFMSEDEMAKN
jgi:hypothetical protein